MVTGPGCVLGKVSMKRSRSGESSRFWEEGCGAPLAERSASRVPVRGGGGVRFRAASLAS